MRLKRLVWWSAGLIPLALVAATVVAYWRSTNACDDRQAAPANPMKAIVYCDYGGPEVLKAQEVEQPAPAADQVLVRVQAAAVNPLDWHYMRGKPYIMRLDSGLRKPKSIRLGVDYAGTVEAVGRNVTRFKPGDEVFGARDGALAEYVSVREDRAVALKPANLTFEQAAGVAVAATTALQGLRDQGRVRAGERVLINGSSGGVGTFAVQIAKAFGAEVTGVCSTRNVDLVRSLGAAHVFDYTREDFATSGQQYDVVLDNVGNRSLSDFRRVLAPNGRLVLIGGGGVDDAPWLGPIPRAVAALVWSRFVSQEMGMFLARITQDDLNILRDLMQAGKVTPIIDRRYRFADAAAAIRYLEGGHARGKVIVTMATGPSPSD